MARAVELRRECQPMDQRVAIHVNDSQSLLISPARWVQNARILDKVNNKLRQILNSLVPVTMHGISGFGRRPSPKCGF